MAFAINLVCSIVLLRCEPINNKSENLCMVILTQCGLAAELGMAWLIVYGPEPGAMECEDTHASKSSTYKSDAPPV